MKLKHLRIQGQSLVIEPLQDKNFPRHSAHMTVWQDWKKSPSYSAMMINQDAAIAYAKSFGYDAPIGF